MPGQNPRFEIYFSKPKHWLAEMNALRRILLDCGLDEELKWRQPCYCLDGANVVILGAFKNFCALNFFKGSLIPDSDRLLVAPGPNSKAGRFMKFTHVDQITGREKLIAKYIRAAIAIEKSGAKVDFSANKAVILPEELEQALKKSAALRKAWDGLTPGRRRSWVLNIDGAKQSKTRADRVAKAVPKILKGLGFHDEYRA
jgi:uncharacterized protein YdeI (YjbR/CyaY-like superfamily)